MDGMKITNNFLTKIVSSFIKRALVKKFNTRDFNINIETLEITFNDDVGHFSVNANGNFTKKDIENFMKTMDRKEDSYEQNRSFYREK